MPLFPMLLQNMEMEYCSEHFWRHRRPWPRPIMFMNDIENFLWLLVLGLNFGLIRDPFIGTTIMQNTDIDYTQFIWRDVKQFNPFLIHLRRPIRCGNHSKYDRKSWKYWPNSCNSTTLLRMRAKPILPSLTMWYPMPIRYPSGTWRGDW